ncbi:MAG: RNA polymerase sigma factor [Gemmatimonadaceae bacterium]|nr:RNA polymerase sigma factor [Gemmatimonadaceae bacterium]
MMATTTRIEVRLPDGDLVQRAVEGSDEAFRRLITEYHPLAYGLAYRALGDREDAEEVVQDAFVKIHGALGGFRGESSLKTWILRIVWHLSLNRRRDRARSPWRRLGLHRADEESGEKLSLPAGEGPEARLLTRETQRLVREEIDDLPPALREVLVLHGFEQLGYEEIARVLDIPVGTVSSRIHTARRRLAAGLQGRGVV